MSKVSIIIPTLNEAKSLQRTLHHLQILHPPAAEIIVVDGGSIDATVEIATEAKVKVDCLSPPSRSKQMNHGASLARGDFLCFVHADTFVPDDLVKIIQTTLNDPTVAAAGFISIMQGENQTRWITSAHNYLKTYYASLLFRPHRFIKGLRVLFGDQVIFCRRQDFWQCGGYDPNLAIMEDADLCSRLGHSGKIKLVNRIVTSSDRRVAKWGTLKANTIYLYIGILWGLGVPADKLKQLYEDIR